MQADQTVAKLGVVAIAGCSLFAAYLYKLYNTKENGEETPLSIQLQKFRVLLPHHEERWKELDKLLQRKIHDHVELGEVFSAINPKATKLGFFKKYLEQPEKEPEKWEFYGMLLPFIQTLARRLPELFPDPIYHLLPQLDDHVSLTREQAACLLANGFLSTFTEPNKRNFYLPNGEKLLFQSFNFLTLFKGGLGATLGTILCIFNYFRTLKNEMRTGNVLIYRKHLVPEITPKWVYSEKKICNVTVSTSGTIEDDLSAEFHADFGNKYIGGGALYGGCAQEEILFAFRPECILSMLVCPVMEANEAVIISGAERFSAHVGYAQSFSYVGPYQDDVGVFPLTSSKAINIVSVDAMASVGKSQYHKENIERELNKLYCALHNWKKYSLSEKQTYATGHWGCGVCGGNKQLKAIEQILAVSEAGGLDINYYTWGGPKFASALVSFVQYLHDSDARVGDVACILFGYLENTSEVTPFEYLFQQLHEKKKLKNRSKN